MSWESWLLVIKAFNVFLSILTETARHSGWASLCGAKIGTGGQKGRGRLELRSQAFRAKAERASG